MRDYNDEPFEELSEEEQREVLEAAAYAARIAERALARFSTAPGVPQNAPERPEMSREIANRQNEPKATPRSIPGREMKKSNVQDKPIRCPKMPRPAPKCPTPSVEMQNEPTATTRGMSRGLSPRQLTAVSALFAGHSFTEIARHLRVDRKTLFRWRRQPGFIAEVNRRYAEQMRPRARGRG